SLILIFHFAQIHTLSAINSLSIIVGLSTSIPMAASTILSPLEIEDNLFRFSAILATILTFVILAALSVKYDLLVRYSRINIYLFIITTIALFTTITAYNSIGIDNSKILPFQGMINKEPWIELLTNPYWWYFEATVVSWSIFCGRFIAYCSNGYSVKEIIKLGTISLIILTVIWHFVSASTGYTLSFSRGWVIYILTALTMMAFAITSLDSASKTLLNDIKRISEKKNLKYQPSFFLKCSMCGIGLINIIILYTGFSKLFTIILCLAFVPFLIKAIIYNIKFAFGKIDFNQSGTITKRQYSEMRGIEDDESDYRRIV
ncbi:BCCT family transporter, partial [Bacteroides acidifaciens]|uniref:BCCT family transporter n=1 Tax=Bacteroides acidifaciens TaxID=85831 RepID=UPI0025B59D57